MQTEVTLDSADGFAVLGLGPALLEALAQLGYTQPTPIQAAAIPLLLAGNDVLGEAATGTGKTAAFALPLLERFAPFKGKRNTQMLVLVPTRELAIQVTQAFSRYGSKLGARVVAVYGGASMGGQIRDLQSGAHIVVATPGRAVDLLNRKCLDLSKIECVVLDEADEMLDMGFSEDLDVLLSAVPESRQTALFSATMPRRILALAQTHQREPKHVKIQRAQGSEDVKLVEERAVVCRRDQTLAAFERILLIERPTSAIVFCRTREDVDEVSYTLSGDGFTADAIHGGMSQAARDTVMRRFREGRTTLLIATDVAARGLDINDLSHVFNLELPESPEVYVHRIGRTGRAGKSGKAISFVTPAAIGLLRRVERHRNATIAVMQVPKTHDIRKSQLERVRAALERIIDEPASSAPEVEALAASMLEGQSPETVLRAALALCREAVFGSSDATIAKVADADFVQRPAKSGPYGRPAYKAPYKAGAGAHGGRPYRAAPGAPAHARPAGKPKSGSYRPPHHRAAK